jgi:hypothetical protein
MPAEADPACAISTLTDSLPADGAQGIPTDLAPLLIFEGDCGVPAPYTLTLYEDGVSEPIRTDV